MLYIAAMIAKSLASAVSATPNRLFLAFERPESTLVKVVFTATNYIHLGYDNVPISAVHQVAHQ